MEKYSILFLLAVASTFACTSPSPALGENWERLGSRTVNFRAEKDDIMVTASEGRFTAIQFRVRDAAINMRRCVVHFGNGGSQEIAIRKNLKRGSSSRVIDLEGGARVIRRVSIWYDTKNRARERAEVVLWGRH